MGATHFLTKRLPKVATEMALNVLAYNIKRVMAIIGVAGLLEALAWRWKSSRELVTASEVKRRASDREAGVKEAWSEAAGRRTGTG
jgi:hypothetical protein